MLCCVFVFIILSLSTTIATTVNYPHVCRHNSSSHEVFKCAQRSECVNKEHVCDGTKDCSDGSDEDFCFTRKRRQSGVCILPPYPDHGSYEILDDPQSNERRPGESLGSFALKVSCEEGYGMTEIDSDADFGGTLEVLCANGRWSANMPKCVRFCKLNVDPSIHYLCSGSKICKKFVSPESLVRPICNSPVYYTTETLLYMKCVAGSWNYVAKCKPDCGRVTPEGVPLVIDGSPAKRGEIPWHVGVYRKTNPYMQIGGGSLISNNVVISAAHCFWSDTKKVLSASYFAVAVGKLYRPWDDPRDVDAQKSDVKHIAIPKLFRGAAANFQEDIAVLTLTASFIYETYIRPVCLNFDDTFDRSHLRQGNLGKVAGWGLTGANGDFSNILKVVDMPFINEATCVNTLPRSFTAYITGDKFCAGYTNGTALCRGDNGGGIVFSDREQGLDRYYLRGIVSTAPATDDKLCNDRSYTTYTKITKHEKFIQNALAVALADNSCAPNMFHCADGTCRDHEANCGQKYVYVNKFEYGDPKPVQAVPVAVPADVSSSIPSNTHKPQCILPPQPVHGSYKVLNLPQAMVTGPGQALDSFVLRVSCEPGYGMLETGSSNGTLDVYCVNGVAYAMPKCVRFCELVPDPSVRFTCPGNKQCPRYVAPNSLVTPECNSPVYESSELLLDMQCVAGFWDHVVRCKPDCGRVTPEGVPLIIDGKPAKRGELPWHVGIYRKTNTYLQICGGSLVSNNVVISAAHCFWSDVSKLLPASGFAVAIGKLFRTWDDERDVEAQKSDVINIRIPDLFQGARANFQADIAILTLATPFVFKTYVRPVCLHFGHGFDTWHLQHNNLGKVAGWGLTEANGVSSEYLRVVNMPFINEKTCITTLPQAFRALVTSDKFCAGYTNGTSLCRGDSGGGMYFSETEQGLDRYYLRGIVSTAPTTPDKLCNDRSYSTFTRITRHESLIKKCQPQFVTSCVAGDFRNIQVTDPTYTQTWKNNLWMAQNFVPCGNRNPWPNGQQSEIDHNTNSPPSALAVALADNSCAPNMFHCADGTCRDREANCGQKYVYVNKFEHEDPKPVQAVPLEVSAAVSSSIPSNSDSPVLPSINKKGQARAKCKEYSQRYRNFCRSAETIQEQGYLTGGREANRGEFPHMALLGYGTNSSSAEWFGNGFIISEKFILTVAHLVNTNAHGPVKFAALGILKRSDPPEIWKIYRIKKTIRHPDYKARQKYNDIALLETETEIIFDSTILPICLDDGTADTNKGIITGWGNNRFRDPEPADVMKAIYMTGVSESTCKSSFGANRELPHGFNFSTMMCYIQTVSLIGPCERDVGDPVQALDSNCLYTATGIMSFGQPCKSRSLQSVIRVSHYVPWIEDIVW